MSFRKRGEIINRPNPTAAAQNRRAPIGRVPVTLGRVPGNIVKPPVEKSTNHPGTKPSVITSHLTTSTGSKDLDKILVHQGIPLGTSLLIEENGTTDFASTLIKLAASQGLVHNRLDPRTPNTHLVVIGCDPNWAHTLPGVYKSSSRRSVAKPEVNNNLKIAWRYGLKDKETSQNTISNYPNYTAQFDITSTMVPAPSAQEITFIKGSAVIEQLEEVIRVNDKKVIRVLMPSFLNPFANQCVQSESLRLGLRLRSLLKKHPRIVMIASISLHLFPRSSSPAVASLENIFDSTIELKPFEPELYGLLERTFKNQPAKVKHGFINVRKLPILSELGLNVVTESEYSFKNGRKNFEIEEWSIPVDEIEEEENKIDF